MVAVALLRTPTGPICPGKLPASCKPRPWRLVRILDNSEGACSDHLRVPAPKSIKVMALEPDASNTTCDCSLSSRDSIWSPVGSLQQVMVGAGFGLKNFKNCQGLIYSRRKFRPIGLYLASLWRASENTWVVLKLMVPLLVLSIIQHLVFRGPLLDHNFHNHPHTSRC